MPRKEGCSICRLLSAIVTLAVIGAGAYAAWFFLGKPSSDELVDIAIDLGEKIKEIDFGDFTDVLENFTGFSPDMWNEDPFVGDNTTNVWVGHTDGEGGLSLELWNALDDTWTSEYEEAISDWNTLCTPKVLELTSKEVEMDRECTQADGVMKVCNGNYGETGWLGINEVLKSVPQGIIQSSVAKMNEHYLLNADYDERLYTMCHEIGHGFGLPHTDENFNNKDLGNCLDYTNSPSNNLRPGDVNCLRLLEMYGSVNRRRTSEQRRTLRHRSDAERYEDETEDDEVVQDDDYNDDDARYYFDYARSQYPDMSAEYETAMQEMYYQIKEGSILQTEAQTETQQQQEDNYDDEDNDSDTIDLREDRGRGKWRRLGQHSRGGDFVRRLNDGFELEVHVLYPNNRE